VTAEGRFAGRVLFATGAGSGIAAATARRFAADGGRVAVADLEADRAASVAGELPGSVAVHCDVGDEGSVEAAVREARASLGRIDCVLNAAGYVQFAPIEELSLADWNRMLTVHLTGAFLVCRATLPALREAGGGSIVNLASVTALVARPTLAAYSAAKGGVIAFSRQLALDVVRDGIRVNVVAPGSVRTPLTADVYGATEADTGRFTPPSSIQARIAEPEEIAAAVCFLLSDEASFFTGALLVPDGGATAV
jgi:3-oxoacyl-[acyl-carrier protein] reductase